jgi:tetratricopeptide (TPR) repeat protein
MPKVGRNEPCPCGSGNKYKRCCLDKDQAFEREALAAARQARQDDDERYDELAAASNAVVDLIDADRLDDAEAAAHDLLERFPEVHDGYARLGLIHEIRGNTELAIEYYRKVIAFARDHPDPDEPVIEADYQKLIARLGQSKPNPSNP